VNTRQPWPPSGRWRNSTPRVPQDKDQRSIATNWLLLAKFEGEFANGLQAYAGSGTLLYTW
jgi:hypothetical protein